MQPMPFYKYCYSFCLLVALTAMGCGEKNVYQAPPPPEVTVANPTPAVVADTLDYTGTTEPSERVEIRARVKGFLESAPIAEGENVKRGQPLFVIDPQPFKAGLDAANADLLVARALLSSAQANLKQAGTRAANDEAQYRRAKRASAQGAVTQAELDELLTKAKNSVAGIDVAKAAVTSANAQITSSQAAVTQAKLDYSYTRVTSPIDGRVGRKMVDLGNLVGASEATLLTVIIKYDPIYAIFTISENEYHRLRKLKEEGSKSLNKKNEDPTLVRLRLSGEEGYPHEGVLNYADLGIDQSTGTYLLRAEFPNKDRTIPPGSFVRIQIPLKKVNRLLIDDAAISRDQNGPYVAVVDAENIVSRKHITVGRLYEGRRVVMEGLEPEDRVVVNGIQMARPGAKVNPKEAVAKASPKETPPAEAKSSGTPST